MSHTRVLVCVMSAVATAAARAAGPPTPITNGTPRPTSDTSYQIGLLLGDQLEHNGLASKITLNEVVRGLKDGLAGHAQTAQERDATVRFMRGAHEALADSNRKAAHDFLARNAKEAGIHSMPSGLQYRVLAEGDPSGKPPSLTDQVTVRYRAMLPDGHEFDRSETHERPATFRVNGVFKAWQEAFVAMRPGAKWQLFVPPELGYDANTPPGVPPGSLLIYDLELLKIEPPPPVDPKLLRRVPAPAPGEPGPPTERNP
jgi:FKBP-type peptidyl-prolyl cis-trans isomerase FklB